MRTAIDRVAWTTTAARGGLVMALWNVIELLRAHQLYRETVTVAGEAIEIMPDVALFHLARAIGLLAIGDRVEAEQAVRRSLELDDSMSWSHSQLSLALLSQGRPGDAVDPARRAVELLPEAAVLHQRLGDVLVALGAVTEAREAFREARRLDPDLAAAQVGLASVEAAAVDSSPRRQPEAAPDLRLRWIPERREELGEGRCSGVAVRKDRRRIRPRHACFGVVPSEAELVGAVVLVGHEVHQ
jgi:tetratricopeptide (TPR) repeat protein